MWTKVKNPYLAQCIYSYEQMLRNIFHYSGRCSRKDFWIPVGIHAVIFLCFYCIEVFCFLFDLSFFGMMFAVAFSMFQIYNFVATLPLTIRRLHDAGHTIALLIVSWCIGCVVAVFCVVALFCLIFLLIGEAELFLILLSAVGLSSCVALGVEILLFVFLGQKSAPNNKYGLKLVK